MFVLIPVGRWTGAGCSHHVVAEEVVMGFKGMWDRWRWQVKAQSDCLCVLAGRVERITQVHQKRVAVPTKVVLDI